MGETYITLIMWLLGFIQTIFLGVIAYIFSTHKVIFALISTNTKRDAKHRQELEDKITNLLDKHYVTNGQLTTIEERLIGKLDGLSQAIASLNKLIGSKL